MGECVLPLNGMMSLISCVEENAVGGVLNTRGRQAPPCHHHRRYSLQRHKGYFLSSFVVHVLYLDRCATGGNVFCFFENVTMWAFSGSLAVVTITAHV
jgi:hypothetical protein